MSRNVQKQFIIVTGSRGSGKSAWCAEAASIAKSNTLSVGGLLSPARFDGNRKVGIDLLDLATGERRQLAQRRSEDSGGIITGDWMFNPTTVTWGNRILKEVEVGDLTIIDELGPLEFEKGIGLIEGLKLIDEKRFRAACVVVRPNLLETARTRWPEAKVIDVTMVPNTNQVLGLMQR